MDIETRGNEIVISGNIKTVEDGIAIKNVLRDSVNDGQRSFNLKIIDSFSMTSSVIGCLMNLVQNDKVVISVAVYNNNLYTLLDELGLLKILNVRQASTGI